MSKCITTICPADTNCADHQKPSLTEHCEACTFCTTCLIWVERKAEQDMYAWKLAEDLRTEKAVADAMRGGFYDAEVKRIKAQARIERLKWTAILGTIIALELGTAIGILIANLIAYS
jgi:hypothetical protein